MGTPLTKDERSSASFLRSINWNNFDMASSTQEFHDNIEERFGKFFMTRTKTELQEEAVKRGIQLCPINNIEDIVKDPQLAARGYWAEIENPELDTIINYPGSFIKSTSIPPRKPLCAPSIGAHNNEVYCNELGLSRENLVMLKGCGVI